MFLIRFGVLVVCLSVGLAQAQGEPGSSFRVEIEIAGIEGDLLRNVRAFLSLYRERNHPFLNPSMARRLYAKAAAEIRAALQPFGYYRPTIADEVDESDPKLWRIRFLIDPGPPLPVGELHLRLTGEGATDPDLKAALGHLPLKVGDTFDHRRYEDSKQRLLEIVLEQGYPNAHWERRRAEVDLAAYRARIWLVLNTGPRYRLGPLHLRQAILDEDFLRSYLPYSPGSPYRTETLLRLQRALNDSGYFARAEVHPLIDESVGREVPVEARVTPLPPDHYGLGVGYGTDTGMRGRFTWMRRYLNRRGHRLSAEVYVAEVGDRQKMDYLVPLAYENSRQFVADASRQSEHVADRLRETLRFQIAYSQELRGWRQSYALDYQFERYWTATARQTGRLFIPRVALTHLHADHSSRPRFGHRLDVELQGALARLFSSTDFFQFTLGARVIRPAFRDDRWLLRAKGGHTFIRDLDRLPLSLRYFSGGDRSLRGFGYQSVATTSGEGGSNLLEGSVEYEHHLHRRWSVALFLDAANVSADGVFPLERGAGVGLRWRSPVGPVRLDVAWALSRSGRPWRLHFNVGPDL